MSFRSCSPALCLYESVQREAVFVPFRVIRQKLGEIMARTSSNMMPLGTRAPTFSLINTVDGGVLGIDQVKGERGLLVMFICNHCPYVKHMQVQLGELGMYQAQGVGVVAISSNDVENYPADSPELMSKFAAENHFDFPYLYDETQEVARAYQAACTPDFFLFDEKLQCIYRGQFDDSRPGNDIPVSGTDLKAAIGACIRGEPVLAEQTPSLGCNIKWKT